MKKRFAILVCAVAVITATIAAQKQGGSAGSDASFEKWARASIKATNSNDSAWMQANLDDAYVEGTSYGAWLTKAQLLKDAADPANNKFNKDEVSDLQAHVSGNIGTARFREAYDAIIEGQHRARTIICTMTAEKQGNGWKGVSNHCSKIE